VPRVKATRSEWSLSAAVLPRVDRLREEPFTRDGLGVSSAAAAAFACSASNARRISNSPANLLCTFVSAVSAFETSRGFHLGRISGSS
jgi:hypothetical protein